MTHPYRKGYQKEIAKIQEAYPAVVEVPQWLKTGKIRDAWIYGGPFCGRCWNLRSTFPDSGMDQSFRQKRGSTTLPCLQILQGGWS